MEKVNIKTYEWDNVNMPHMGIFLTKTLTNFLERILPHKSGQFALDIGCGTGKYYRLLNSYGFSTISMDYILSPLQIFQKRFPDPKIVQADGQWLPFADNSFNLVLAIEVQDYFADREMFYQEVNRVLVPGGLFIVTATNKRSIKGVLYESYLKLKKRKRTGQFYSTPLSSDIKKLEDHSFKIKEMWGYNWNILPRDCNNKFIVNLFAKLEKILKLEKIPHLSPLIFVYARKGK